jgi:hypothetical protein
MPCGERLQLTMEMRSKMLVARTVNMVLKIFFSHWLLVCCNRVYNAPIAAQTRCDGCQAIVQTPTDR